MLFLIYYFIKVEVEVEVGRSWSADMDFAHLNLLHLVIFMWAMVITSFDHSFDYKPGKSDFVCLTHPFVAFQIINCLCKFINSYCCWYLLLFLLFTYLLCDGPGSGCWYTEQLWNDWLICYYCCS